MLYVNRYNVAGDIVSFEVNMQLEYEEQCRTMKMSFYNNETKEIKELTEKYIENDEKFNWNDFWVTDKYICLNAGKISGEATGVYIFDFSMNLVKNWRILTVSITALVSIYYYMREAMMAEHIILQILRNG